MICRAASLSVDAFIVELMKPVVPFEVPAGCNWTEVAVKVPAVVAEVVKVTPLTVATSFVVSRFVAGRVAQSSVSALIAVTFDRKISKNAISQTSDAGSRDTCACKAISGACESARSGHAEPAAYFPLGALNRLQLKIFPTRNGHAEKTRLLCFATQIT